MMNKSGFVPTMDRCLVKLDKEPEKTEGGVYLPDTIVDKRKYAQTEVTLLAVGGNAFSDWEAPIPKNGDRVLISFCEYWK